MITAARLQDCRSAGGVIELLRDLGYPAELLPVHGEEWRRAGVALPWNGEAELSLVSRLPNFDLFVLNGEVPAEAVGEFLRSYARYNVLTRSAVINTSRDLITLYGIDSGHRLRRLAVSADAPTKAVLDRLNLLALAPGSDRDVGRIFDRALDRESVTRRFFVRFRNAVRDVAAALSAGSSVEEAGQYALLVLSRLLFLSFIQEKGWLNGERRFLVDRLEEAEIGRREFFATVLLPLFFGCLNTPAGERAAGALPLGRIPYLNGGLFEPSPFERRRPELHVSNELMRSVIEEVFERFDFTVEERDAGGSGVDPEMLGRVFESLMAEDERAASGSFYTPKEIVDVLTGNAITEWLSRGDRSLRDALRAALAGGGMPPVADTAGLLQRLAEITVLDPACGSGAFLLSALHVIEQLTRRLSPDQPAGLRQRIVSRSLYGVDLKPEAVRLCELRLWLAIVSTSDATVETVAPLPNLDRNILQGNALLGPVDFLGAGRADIYREWSSGIRAQRDLVDRYRGAPRAERPALYRMIRANDARLATELLERAIAADEGELEALSAPSRDLFGEARPDLNHCRRLQARIAATRRALESVEQGELDFFSFDVHFAPVMSAGGFDVVVGNPPWVRSARIDPQTRAMVRERYPLFRRGAGAAGFHQPDLSLAFFERAALLAGPDGVVSLLMPSKIANAGYAAPLRRFAAADLGVRELIDWSSEGRRLFSADTFPLALIASRRHREEPAEVTADGQTFPLPQSALAAGEWQLVPPEVAAILQRLRGTHPPLEESIGRRPVMGVKTGDNRSFFLEVAAIEGSHVETEEGIRIPAGAVCRCVRGRDLRRWRTVGSHWMLWPPPGGWRDVPEWLQRLSAVRGCDPHAFRLAWVRPEHVGIKVAWKDVSRGMAAAVLPDAVSVGGQAFPLIPNQTLYSVDAVSLDEAYVVAALLNSTVADALLFASAERAKDDHFRYFGRTVARMPLPRVAVTDPYWARLVRLSRGAHRSGITPSDLDAIVAVLYGVSARELEVLRAFCARRSGAR